MSSGDDPRNPGESEEPRGEKSNGENAFNLLGEFFREDGWKVRQLEDQSAYSTGYSGKNGDYHCYAIIRVDLEEFLFYAVSPVRVPEQVRAAVSEFITRANFGMRIGNFEMDYSDGEVRYKSSLNFEGEPLTHRAIHNVIYPAIHTADRYLPGLLRVSFGAATPLEAIEEIEGPPEEKDE